ncbi:MAG: type IV pilin protein [Lysobacterales bacterium]|nr:prepilin-type N-terminal cleavage/methylation domain-containing protein [Xanthomonadales bacterium]MCB1611781.1 prepilin-type N-terminal cleavage/methylation domain-containing protein [Xanthomonadales bacterium]MCP5474691.1 prepilin-type N-terminal cleavage/methylation domain-containing protein [Rhodanobacteraceae bacterium]
MSVKNRTHSGFTLVELVVVMAILAIIAAIALPAYQNYVLRARRVEGREMLQRIASAQERFYTNRNRYTDDLTTNAGLNLATTTSEGGYYVVGVLVAADGQSYTLTATPQGAQSVDQCANLTVNNVGARGFSGSQTNGKCW